MAWGDKECDWQLLVSTIQSEIDANIDIIPDKHIKAIQHYLDHDEYSMAFEYLYLEIAERADAKFTLGVKKANEIALFFDLDKEDECMISGEFWNDFQSFLARHS